jgi:flavin-dependent dehydrogenase
LIKKCDVAIIGGGIAGLSIAKFLSDRKIPFILLEKHKDFFKKACGEGVIRFTMNHDFFELYESKKGIENEVWDVILYTKYGKLSLRLPIIMIDKKKIECELARRAVTSGEIKMGEKVEKIIDGVLLPQKIKPRIIVGADGVFSVIRRYIGIRKIKCGIAAQGLSNNVCLDPKKCHIILKKDIAGRGYAWYFPKKNCWNIGIGGCGKHHFRKDFLRFKEMNNALNWRGALVPIDKPLKSYGKNALLLGDAAAHVVANLGEGIMPTLIASKIAAEVIEQIVKNNFKEMDLSIYEKRCKQIFGKYLNQSYYASIIFFRILKNEYIRHKVLIKMCEKTNNYYKTIFKKKGIL